MPAHQQLSQIGIGIVQGAEDACMFDVGLARLLGGLDGWPVIRRQQAPGAALALERRPTPQPAAGLLVIGLCIGARFPLPELVPAMEALLSQDVIGKIVLTNPA